MGLGALSSAVSAQDVTLPPNLTIGGRTVGATGVLTGSYYNPDANPPSTAFNSASGIRDLEAQYRANPDVEVSDVDLNVNLDFDQGGGNNPPFFPHATNDSLASVWSGEIVVSAAAAGVYRFDSASDDGTVGFIDSNYIVQNNFYQGRTRRNFTVNLTEGTHSILMGWYEGGSGANGTFWLYPNGTAEKILNPAAPPAGITFQKVTYATDNTYNGKNLIVNDTAKLDVIQENSIKFGSLTVADGKTFTINTPLTPISFTGSKIGATNTLDVTGGRVDVGKLTGGPVTTLRKTGGGTVLSTESASGAVFTATSTLQISGGNFVGRSRGAGVTPSPSSIGDTKIMLDGGTFTARGVIFDQPGIANSVGVTFWSGTSSEAQVDPIDSGVGLLARGGGTRIEHNGTLSIDDDNPDFGFPNFSVLSGGAVGVDNLQVLGYGLATFTTDATNGDVYTFGNHSDDGVVTWIDLDKDGVFEKGDNGSGKNELVMEDNTFHAPQTRFSAPVTIPAGEYRVATGFYEGGGNAVMDFRVARGTQTAANHDELKAKFAQMGPGDSSVITKWSSLISAVNSDFTKNPVTVTGNSGLATEGSPTKFGDVSLANGSVLTTSGGDLTFARTIVDGSARINMNSNTDIGKLEPATAGANITLIKGGGATLNLRTNTTTTTLPATSTIGVAGGRLEVAGATATTPSSVGAAGLRLEGGTLAVYGAFGGITDAPGAADSLTEYVYYIGGDQTPLVNPIMATTGLFNRSPTRTNILTGPIGGPTAPYNDAHIATRFGIEDNVVSMWYGEMTFTDGGLGNEYTFASKTDDGSVWWVDIDNDGKFESPDNGGGKNELVLDNNFYQGPTGASGLERRGGPSSVTINPGTYRVALGFYEGGGGALADFKFGRGNVVITGDAATRNAAYDDPLNFLVQVNPTDKSVASFRARTYTPVDAASPSLSTNAITVAGNTTVEANGAAVLGPTTFANTATLSTAISGVTLTSATTASGTGTINNGSGPNRVSVGDVGASAGATTAFAGQNSRVTGSLTGAGTVQVNSGVLEFTRNGDAASGTPSLGIQRGALGTSPTMRFAPGSGNTFGASEVAAVANEGILHAANGTVDLSSAVITTTSAAPTTRPGLLETTLNGGFNITESVQPPTDFAAAKYTLDLNSANVRDTDAARTYPTNSTQVYTGEINIPDTDGDGRAGPIAFGEHFDDGTLVKIDGQEVINDGSWDVYSASGEIELPVGKGPGWYPFEARLGRGGGPNGQQAPWDVFGIGIDTTAPFEPREEIYRGANGEQDGAIDTKETSYARPVDNGSMNLFRFTSPTYGQVQVDSGATLRVGSIVGANRVNIAADARLQLNGPTTSKIQASALTIAGTAAAPTGTLDVGNSAIALDYPTAGPSPAADVRMRIIVGRGAPGLIGTWNGKGITSSASQAAPDSTSVGYAVNADMPLGAVPTFRGQPVDPTTVLIRHTKTGDANLDGVVNDDDVTIVGAMYAPGTANAAWANGDFDYNGFVDDDDVTLLGALYAPGDPPIPAPAGGGVAAVPEPSTWLMLTLGGLGAGLFGWRRRKT
jgi:hypothetical protein